MFPYDSNESSGVFVLKRVKLLKEFGIDAAVFALVIKHNHIISKMFRINDIELKEVSKKYDYINYLIYRPRIWYYSLKKAKYYSLISKNFANKIENLIDINNFDLIHAHFIQGAGSTAYILSKNTKIPYIITAHGSDIHTNPYKDSSIRNLTVEVLNNAYSNIFVSNYLLNEAKKLGYVKNNNVVIYNGYDKDIFYPIEKSKARRRLGFLKDKKIVIGYVGNLYYVKGANFLPLIFNELSKVLKNNVQFLVVGSGKLKKYIEKNCKRFFLDVFFFDRVPQQELLYVYNSLDVLIIPSIREGLSCVGIEAQACGTPVVASNAGGLPEVIGINPKYNRLVEIKNDIFVNSFVEKIIEILSLNIDRFEIAKNVSFLEWRNIINQEIRLYEKSLGGKDK